MTKYCHYNILADVFRYPEEDFPVVVNRCQQFLEQTYPEAAMELSIFANYIHHHSRDEQEELYTKTFDVQPVCYLDLGYVIFGEDYKRGAFLLHMQEEQLKVGNDCGTDLPDNICNILTLFLKTNDQQFIEELAVKILIPGVKKMIGEFEQSRIELKTKVLRKLHSAIIQEELNTGNVYRNAFSALLSVLEKDFEGVHFEEAKDPAINLQHHQSFFAKQSINREINKQVNIAEVNNLINNYKLD